MFKVADIELIANGEIMTLPGRDGAATVSPTFGVRSSYTISPVIAEFQIGLSKYIEAASIELQIRAALILKATGIFVPGTSIFWITTAKAASPIATLPIMRSFTMANIPDAVPLERIFDITKKADFDVDTVYQEIGRIAEVRAGLGLIAA